MCPCCGQPLVHHDSFGRFWSHQDGTKCGDIYKCGTCEGEGRSCFYHATVARPDDLKPGHPC